MSYYNTFPTEQCKIERVGVYKYIGWATHGSPTSASTWGIVRFEYDVNNLFIGYKWARGFEDRVNIWDNKASLVYE